MRNNLGRECQSSKKKFNEIFGDGSLKEDRDRLRASLMPDGRRIRHYIKDYQNLVQPGDSTYFRAIKKPLL